MTTLQRILIADSDAELLEQYVDRLTAAGYDVRSATDALSCVDHLKHFDPELLILEPMIPWGQGEGIMCYMREEADVPLVPVIILTSGTDLLEGYQLPRFPVLERHQKPLSAKALLDSVQHIAQVTSVRR